MGSTSNESNILTYSGHRLVWIKAFPPDDVIEAAGLTYDQVETLVTMNDNKKSFEEIADWIEKNL